MEELTNDEIVTMYSEALVLEISGTSTPLEKGQAYARRMACLRILRGFDLLPLEALLGATATNAEIRTALSALPEGIDIIGRRQA